MIWGRYLHYPWTWLTSKEGMLPMSRMTLPTPLLPWPPVPHSFHMTMATSSVPPTQEELDQKPWPSPQLPFELNPGLGWCWTKWINLMTGSGYRWAGKEGTLIGGKNIKLFTGAAWWMTSATFKHYNLPDGRLQPSDYPLPKRMHPDGWGPLVVLVHYIIRNSYPELIPPA